MGSETKDVGLSAVLAILVARRRFLGLVILAFLIGTGVLSLVMPRVYTARSTLLPPVQASRSIPGLGEMESSLGLLGMQDQSMATAKLFAQILRSRVVMEGVIRSQNLFDWFELRGLPEPLARERAVIALSDASDFSVNATGILTVTVSFGTRWFAGSAGDDQTRRRAADVANQFVEQLDQINRDKSLSRAKQSRLYLERQLQENEETIRKLSGDVAQFQRQHGAVALDAQTKALIAAASQLQGRLLAKQVELGVAEQSMTNENPLKVLLEQEVQELRKKLNGMEGIAGDTKRGDTWMDLPASQIPDLQYQMARYERELQAQLLLQTYLNQQYYQAKIQEASDAPSIQVLDPAVPPQVRTSPKRKFMAIAGLLSGLMVGIAAVAIREAVRSRRRPIDP